MQVYLGWIGKYYDCIRLTPLSPFRFKSNMAPASGSTKKRDGWNITYKFTFNHNNF